MIVIHPSKLDQFLDISKAFGKAWHKGLLHKLKSLDISGKVYELIENYSSRRFQTVTLNGETSSWRPILTGVPQGSSLGPLLFFTYPNGLPNELKTNVDDTSLFTTVKDKNEGANALNNDLSLISKCAFNWKMLFNPDPHKPAQEGLFSSKKKVSIHPVISLNNIQVEKASLQEHLGLFLDEKLTFKHHIHNTLCKVDKGRAIIKN